MMNPASGHLAGGTWVGGISSQQAPEWQPGTIIHATPLASQPGSQFPGGAWLGGTSVASFPPVSNPLARVGSLLEQQYQELRDLMYRIPGVARPLEKGPEEATRDFLNRFNKEKVAIPRCDIATAIEAFRQGLRQDSDLYKDLTKYPCTTFEEVQTKAIAVMRLEEDSGPRRAAYGTDSTSIKAPVEKQNERAKPYSKPVNKVSEGPGGKNNSEPPPKVSEYKFSTNLAGVLKALKEIRGVRWPQKRVDERPNDKRDSSKRCEYHDDIGHDTDECYTLRKEVKFQYDRGNLDHLLPGGSTKVHSANQVLPTPPPMCTRIVNVITGGSELCGLTYSAAKRHATQTKGDKPEFSCRVSRQDLPAVTFDETGAQNAPEQHNDALIITLPIGNCEVRKILVDTGSSVNLIMLETLKVMGPWIHEMKAIPSTYHQCLKFPTPWGVQEIRGDQEEAKNCYKIALKPTAKPPKIAIREPEHPGRIRRATSGRAR
ncbi:uncharacterized protein LOC141629287 [Silene latifolia]|uniref:uncharacterized protein LOC141629287 n=1 Tax=Silene latifolia TaxID=37657 RepID=UPI003D77C3B2